MRTARTTRATNRSPQGGSGSWRSPRRASHAGASRFCPRHSTQTKRWRSSASPLRFAAAVGAEGRVVRFHARTSKNFSRSFRRARCTRTRTPVTAESQAAGDGFVSDSLELAREQDLPVDRREGRERATQQVEVLLALFSAPAGGTVLHRAFRTAASDDVDGRMHGDRPDPGGEGRALLVTGQRAVRTQEGLLRRVLRQGHVARDAPRAREGRGSRDAHELGEGVRLAAAGPFDQLGFPGGRPSGGVRDATGDGVGHAYDPSSPMKS